MARPVKFSLPFYCRDVNMWDDEKLHFYHARFGALGRALVDSLLCRIYSKGYCYRWDEESQFIFADKEKFEVGFVREAVEMLVEKKFFRLLTHDGVPVLTSRGIQRRWLLVMKGCKEARIHPDLDLISNSGRSEEQNKNGFLAEKPGFSGEKPLVSCETPEVSGGKTPPNKCNKYNKINNERETRAREEVFREYAPGVSLTEDQHAALLVNHCNGNEPYLRQQLQGVSAHIRAHGVVPKDLKAYVESWIWKDKNQFGNRNGAPTKTKHADAFGEAMRVASGYRAADFRERKKSLQPRVLEAAEKLGWTKLANGNAQDKRLQSEFSKAYEEVLEAGVRINSPPMAAAGVDLSGLVKTF